MLPVTHTMSGFLLVKAYLLMTAVSWDTGRQAAHCKVLYGTVAGFRGTSFEEEGCEGMTYQNLHFVFACTVCLMREDDSWLKRMRPGYNGGV